MKQKVTRQWIVTLFQGFLGSLKMTFIVKEVWRFYLATFSVLRQLNDNEYPFWKILGS